jgi:hypothetical protein
MRLAGASKGRLCWGAMVTDMRGKKAALAVIVLMLLAGQALNYVTPNYDTAGLDEPDQATTQLNDSPTTAVK